MTRVAVEIMKKRFMERWESRDLGELKEFLHMRIGRAGQNIYIDQAQYLQAVLQRCGMVNAKAVPTPLPVGYAPVKSLDKAADPELWKRYQTMIGSLLYLMLGTRPDILFAVTKMAQFTANPTEDCPGGPRRSPEIQSTLVWSSCWGATGSAGRSTQRGEQRRVMRTRGNKGEVGVTRDQCRVW